MKSSQAHVTSLHKVWCKSVFPVLACLSRFAFAKLKRLVIHGIQKRKISTADLYILVNVML